MHRISIATLIPLLLALLVLFGCDKPSEAATETSQANQSETIAPRSADSGPVNEVASAPHSPRAIAATRVSSNAEQAPAASAFILIQDAAPTDPQLLLQQLQQVLPKTMVVKLAQSPNKRDVKLEVTNVKDLRALANKIPYGSVDSIDDRTRTITVEY